MPTKPTFGWIGAGRMGYEMAGLLAKGGGDVLVWNRTRAKATPLEKYGAKVADQLAELAARACRRPAADPSPCPPRRCGSSRCGSR